MSDQNIPVIDIQSLYGSDKLEIARTASLIGDACRGIGFFYIKGHGLSLEDIAALFATSHEFFALAEDVKKQVEISPATGNRGYVPMRGEALDPSKPADLKEAFNIGLELAADDPELVAGARFRALNLWPEQPGFRESMLDYFDTALDIGRRLHMAFAADLGLEPDHFEDKLDRPLATLRLLHYPSQPGVVEDGQMGAGAHTDYGCVTLLLTDEVGGLEVRTRSGDWIKAPYSPGAFVCNIGDCLMRWTNDTYVSTPHRVLSPAGRERYSIAFFLDPNPDAIVECLPTCSGPGNPPRYAPIRGDDYLESRLNPTYKASGLA